MLAAVPAPRRPRPRERHPALLRGPDLLLLPLLALSACGGDPPRDPPPPPAPVGSAVIRFTLENADGEEVSCSSENLTGFRISLGGVPKTGICGDPQEVRFPDLLPGRFPVLIELLAGGDAVVRDHVGNLTVEDQRETEYAHAFPVDAGAFGTGTMEVRWFIDGEDPARGCAVNRGGRVRIRLLDGPQDDLTLERTCADGQAVIEDVRQGTYRVELDLFDTDGERIGFPAVEPRVRLDSNTTERVFLDVVTALPTGGDLLGLWTVNSSVAADGCAVLDSAQVEMAVRTDDSGAITIATATAACAAGGIGLSDLPVGRTAEGAALRVIFRLIDTSFGTRVVDTQIVRDVVIQPSGTSTAAVDFQFGDD